MRTQSLNSRIGVLALQGDFEAHGRVLAELGAKVVPIRLPSELDTVDGLILPGGESTTIGKLMERVGLDEAIKARASQGMPIYGTCAGMILLAQRISESDQPRLGLLDIEVARNAFGRQVESFETPLELTVNGTLIQVNGVFIRAPWVTEVGPNVEVLCTFRERIVAVRQDNILATAFHPELTGDSRVHELFLEMVGV